MAPATAGVQAMGTGETQRGHLAAFRRGNGMGAPDSGGFGRKQMKARRIPQAHGTAFSARSHPAEGPLPPDGPLSPQTGKKPFPVKEAVRRTGFRMSEGFPPGSKTHTALIRRSLTGALHDRRGKRGCKTAEKRISWPFRTVKERKRKKGGADSAAWDAGVQRTKAARNILRTQAPQRPETGRTREQLSGWNRGTMRVPRGDKANGTRR